MPYLDGLHTVPWPTKYPLKEENATNAGVWRFSTAVVVVDVSVLLQPCTVLYCTVECLLISKY